jgi:hypothetical protein
LFDSETNNNEMCMNTIFALCLPGTAEQGVGGRYSSRQKYKWGGGAKIKSKMKILDRCLQGKVNKTIPTFWSKKYSLHEFKLGEGASEHSVSHRAKFK